jgi:acyl-homoserine lactone acylase PvdQ
LTIIREEIKVKGQLSQFIEVKLTHRGPVINNDHFQAASILFDMIPKVKGNGVYSL